jgi:hypothetical protein
VAETEVIRGKRFEVAVRFGREHVVISVTPDWDLAEDHTLDIVLRRDRLEEELDEQLRDLLHLLAEARRAIKRRLEPPTVDRPP